MTEQDIMLCAVYTSDRTEETYLFVDQKMGLAQVPDDLLDKFSNPRLVTQFKLHEQRKLARAEATVVLASIRNQGFYLQMPPPKDAHLSAVADRNEMLPRQP